MVTNMPFDMCLKFVLFVFILYLLFVQHLSVLWLLTTVTGLRPTYNLVCFTFLFSRSGTACKEIESNFTPH